jgi:hypothetical protein
MKQQFLKLTMSMLLTGALFASCKKDDPVEANEEEVITTMRLTFAPVGGGATLTYQLDDPDGPGGTAPTLDEIVLAPSKTYNVAIQILNKTKTPVEDITPEIRGEADAHRFYYEAAAGLNVTVGSLDNDANGAPLGLTSTWTTGAVSTGKLNITLRHYGGNPPGKLASDPENSTKSETDISTRDFGGFTVKVQ